MGNPAIITVPVAPSSGALGVNKSIAITNNPLVLSRSILLPTGLNINISGTGCGAGSYTTPVTENWSPSSMCTIEFPAPQDGSPGTRYLFQAWDDSDTSNPRVFATPSGATTYTASFRSQYLLSTAVNPPETGAVTGAGYRDANSAAPVVATCDPGYNFISWTGPVTASTSPSTEVLMAAPVTVTANCQLITAIAMPPASGHYNESVTLSATVGPPWNFVRRNSTVPGRRREYW